MMRLTTASPRVGALELTGSVQALKNGEDLFSILRVKANPIIPHKIGVVLPQA
jgi:hypothetical protein